MQTDDILSQDKKCMSGRVLWLYVPKINNVKILPDVFSIHFLLAFPSN